MLETEHAAVSKKIIQAIINSEFKPGQRLPQRKMAERFGVTQITVREAFRSLESSGLIRIEPKWGALVTELTLKQIEEKYIVREALEVMASRILAQTIRESVRIELLQKAEECDTALHEDKLSIQEKAELHFQFHRLIVEATGCQELVKLIDNINLYMILIANTYHFSWHEDYPQAHKRLIENITANPPDIAEKFMRKSIRRGYEKEIEFLQSVNRQKAP